MKLLIKYKKLLCIIVLLTIIASFFLVFSGYCLSGLLDNVINSNGKELLIASISLVGMWAIYIVCNHLSNICQSKIRFMIKNDLRFKISKIITHNFYHDFLNENNEYIAWYNNDVDKIDELYVGGTLTLIEGTFNLLFATFAIGNINFYLLLMIMIMSVIIFIVPQQLSKKLNEKMLAISEKSEYFVQRLTDLNNGLSEFLSFNQLDNYSKYIKESSVNYEQKKVEYDIYYSFINSIITAISCCFQLGSIIFTGILVYLGYVNIGFILSIANLSGSFLNSTTSMLSILPQINAGKQIYNKFKIPINTIHINEETISRLEVKHLSYSRESRQLFKDINFVLKKGEKLLILGDSGCGKSTLLNIIYGMINDYQGEIFFNDRKKSEADIYSDLGYVRQSPHYFNDTIENNLSYLNIEILDEQLISKLNLTHLYKLQKKDNLISGGEKQRLVAYRQLMGKQ